jgi:predicted nucleotidyltransferase
MSRLDRDLLKEVTRRLVAEFRPEKVILFGSHAWGRPDRNSDVDLMVIVTNSDLSAYERAVRGHACLSGLDIAKDVIVETRTEFDFFQDVRASLEHKVAKEGKVLYERSQTSIRTKLAHQSAT